MPARYELEKELCPDRLVLGTEEYPSDIVRLWGLVEKYPHVIIRKGGYSVRFSELGKEAREEFMAVMSRY